MTSGGSSGSADWERIDEILEMAMAVPPGRRTAFLDDVCGTDSGLRSEVESLLGHSPGGDALFSELSRAITGDPPPVQRPEDDGRQVASYRIVRHLGGGMAFVYEARDVRSDRRVVLKTPKAGIDPRAAERLLREAHSESGFAHPNVCQVLDQGFEPDFGPYLVLEFCHGMTLAARMTSKRLAIDLVIRVGEQVADALAGAHAVGIVHRDVKPTNIMVDDQGGVKLLDFGIAKTLGDRLTLSGQVLGTLEYMSPEQVRGEPVGPPTDVWSLGLVLFEALTGEHPFRRPSRRDTMLAIVQEEAPPPSHLSSQGGMALDDVVSRCVARRWQDRPSARELGVALSGIQRDISVAPREPRRA